MTSLGRDGTVLWVFTHVSCGHLHSQVHKSSCHSKKLLLWWHPPSGHHWHILHPCRSSLLKCHKWTQLNTSAWLFSFFRKLPFSHTPESSSTRSRWSYSHRKLPSFRKLTKYLKGFSRSEGRGVAGSLESGLRFTGAWLCACLQVLWMMEEIRETHCRPGGLLEPSLLNCHRSPKRKMFVSDFHYV